MKHRINIGHYRPKLGRVDYKTRKDHHQLPMSAAQLAVTVTALQAGADSIDGDPITHLRFSPAAHGYAAKRLVALADEFCNGRIIAMGGGGYNRNNLALGWNEVLKAMLV